MVERRPLCEMTRSLAATARWWRLVAGSPSPPLAGLMSPEPYEVVAGETRAVSEALARAGCGLNYAFMTLSLLALVVLRELHISDKGLVEVGETGFGLVELTP